MIALIAAAARAGTVTCDPALASGVVEEARIDPLRVPVTHPWLVPGLALGAGSDPALQAALVQMCADPRSLSLERAESWQTGAWAAHTVVLTRAAARGCSLEETSVVITAGVQPGALPRYTLRSSLPPTTTPIGDCPDPARYRSEATLDGAGGPVRLILATDHVGDRVVAAEVLVRTATPDGWREQTLLSPAPARLVGGGSGPRVALHHHQDEAWIVATADREVGEDGACVRRPGQTVWRWRDDRWLGVEGGEALALLTAAGAWRLAGEDGWMLILAQDTPEDAALLEVRRARLQERDPTRPLHLLDSSRFPLLNAGYLVVVPDPYTDAEAARADRRRFGRRAGSYVKRAWQVEDPCGTP